MPTLPIVTVPHPVGGLRPGEVEKKADQILETWFRLCWEEGERLEGGKG